MSLSLDGVKLKLFQDFNKQLGTELSETRISYNSESSEEACLKTYANLQSRRLQNNIEKRKLKECSTQLSYKIFLNSESERFISMKSSQSYNYTQKLVNKIERTPTFGMSEVTQSLNMFKEESKIMQKLSQLGESSEECSTIDINNAISLNLLEAEFECLNPKNENFSLICNKENQLEDDVTIIMKQLSHSAVEKVPKEISKLHLNIENRGTSKRHANINSGSKEMKIKRIESYNSGNSIKKISKRVGIPASQSNRNQKIIPSTPFQSKQICLSESDDHLNKEVGKSKNTANEIIMPNSLALYNFMRDIFAKGSAEPMSPLTYSKSTNFVEFFNEVSEKRSVGNSSSVISGSKKLASTLGTEPSYHINLGVFEDHVNAREISSPIKSVEATDFTCPGSNKCCSFQPDILDRLQLNAKPLDGTSKTDLTKLRKAELKSAKIMSAAIMGEEYCGETTPQPSPSYKEQQSANADNNSPFTNQPSCGKTYNFGPNSILFKEKTLKMLISDKESLKLNVNFNRKAEIKQCYIKRYKKGNLKIFKLKRRVKNVKSKVETPEEKWIKFLKTDRINQSEDLDSVLTPISYETDETKSEAYSTGSNKLPEPEVKLRIGINRISKNKALLFSKQNDSVPRSPSKEEIVTAICSILKEVLAQFEHNGNAYLKFPSMISENCIFKDGRYQLKPNPQQSYIHYNRSRSQAKFNLTLIILQKIKALLESNMKLTKRELYYQLKTLVFDQRVTDRILCELSRMLGIGIWAMNITAQKGLVFGNLNLVMASGEKVNCNAAGALIPSDINDIVEIQSTAYFILIVEKESIYQKLLEEDLPNKLTRPFILVTGKGYPDFGTQLFIKKLWMVISIPVFILVDADPDGISIMLNYRFGSLASAHISEHLVVPKAKWIGVFPSEITLLGIQAEPLSEREVNKLRKMIRLECVENNLDIKCELEVMLETGRKASIEGLIKNETFLSNCYLSRIFYSNKFK